MSHADAAILQFVPMAVVLAADTALLPAESAVVRSWKRRVGASEGALDL
jgi:hypothetical protein